MFGAMICFSLIIISVLWVVIFLSAKYLTKKGRWGLVVSAAIVSLTTLFSISFSVSVVSFLSPFPFDSSTLVTLFFAAVFQVVVSTRVMVSFYKRANETEMLRKAHSYTYPENASEIKVTNKQNPFFSIEIIAAIIQAVATLIAAWITLGTR